MSDKKAMTNHCPIEPPVKSWLLSLLVGVLLTVVVAIMWWLLNDRQQLNLKRGIRTEAQNIASHLSGDMRSRIPALQRIARRWEINKPTQKQFSEDVASYVVDIPGFQAIEWVDKNYHVRWIVPRAGNEKALDFNLNKEEKRRIAIETAIAKRRLAMTSPINLVQGGKGFLVYFPIYVKGEFDGFILAVFKTQKWLKYVLSLRERKEEQKDYRVAVSFNDEIVFKQSMWDTYADSPLAAKENVKVLGHNFTISVIPTESFFKRHGTPLPTLAAASGIALALLITILVYLYQKSSLAIWRSDLVQNALESEINERMHAEEELQETSSRLALATKAGGIGVWTWDVQNKELIWDQRMFELYDIPPDVKIVFETWTNAIHPDDVEQTKTLFTNAVEGKAKFDTEYRVTTSSGEVHYIKAAARIERDERGVPQCVTGVNWDVTDQKRAEMQITHMANHDTLTGLPSLRLAKDRASLALGLAHRNRTIAAIMFIDLDGFKAVNDNHGHDAGDAVLQGVAKRFKSCVREVDTIARIGGDEFLVVVSDLPERKGAEVVANKLVQSVADPFFWKGEKLSVGASVGVSLYPDDGDNAESLIKSADTAMYEVKSRGKNGVAFADLETS
ncbi:MAG: diguanylate cyclase [Pseudodesulfovibrio sp.]